MIKLMPTLAIKPFLLFCVMSLGAVLTASAADAEIAVNVALATAQAHTPGKVVAHEKADEQVGQNGAKTIEPVYRVKILSKQGVMKTLFVHRQTGKVVE
ncbi:PepSY domain-containing protein [Pseudomonas sp. HK3]